MEVKKEDWQVKNISQIAELIKEVFLPNNKVVLSYIGLEHINQQMLSINSIGNSKEIQSQKYVFKKGDILFGKLRPYFRKVYKPNFDGVCSTDIFVLRAKNGINQDFLFYILANSDFIMFASSGSTGTRMPRADWNHIKNFKCRIPSINTQKALAKILSTLDEKIELNNQINKNLEKIAQLLFKHWFIDFEFPNEKGQSYKSSGGQFIDSEFGKIPKGWEIKNLKCILEFEKGIEPGSKNYFTKYNGEMVRFIRISDLNNKENQIYVPYDLSENKICKFDDILLSLDATLGIVCVGYEGYFSSGIRKVHQKEDYFYISKAFIYNLLKTKYIQNTINTYANGTTILHAGNSINHMRIPFPPKNIFELFNNISNNIFKLYLNNLRQNKTLSQIRDSLLPKLITGKIRVNLEDTKES